MVPRKEEKVTILMTRYNNTDRYAETGSYDHHPFPEQAQGDRSGGDRVATGNQETYGVAAQRSHCCARAEMPIKQLKRGWSSRNAKNCERKPVGKQYVAEGVRMRTPGRRAAGNRMN